MDNGSGFTRSFATSERAELADRILDEAWAAARPELHRALCGFLAFALTPIAVYEFEKLLWLLLRSLGRLLMERALNCLEADTREQMPHDLLWDGGGYRALRDKTANRHVATLFGTICLMRRGYRYWHAGVAEASVFPLELALGLVEGVTPALAERICRQMAEAGATQSRVIAWLKCEHGVSMGIKRLRALTEAVSQGMSEFQLESQVATLLSKLHAWARRMLKELKKPSGPSRVLHSAAAMRTRRPMSQTVVKEFEKAYNYIRKRTKYMRYDEYKAAHIPLGSGITEAACKTVFAQRLKLSGMRWTEAGAKSILTLRTCMLSSHWEATFTQYLDRLKPTSLVPYRANQSRTAEMVA